MTTQYKDIVTRLEESWSVFVNHHDGTQAWDGVLTRQKVEADRKDAAFIIKSLRTTINGLLRLNREDITLADILEELDRQLITARQQVADLTDENAMLKAELGR